ncbi:hypothetical protein OHA25_02125 [Nonomuraea sp. NBC_00507]|uniref:hypothetical protein n=1 Tax=Nonomuraea sp. NBC_00507 TaxID=2976002 RepID=UPI002E18DF41
MNEVVLDAIRHNNWATKQLVSFCRDQDLSARQLDVRGVGAFGGILSTLRHIGVSDGSYVRRLAEIDLDWVDGDEDAYLHKLFVWASEAEQLWEEVLVQSIDGERVIVVDNGTRDGPGPPGGSGTGTDSRG